jgi:hypothetical protein
VCQICEVAASELVRRRRSVLRRATRDRPDVRRAAPVRWRSYQMDWRGAIVGYDIPKLRGELNASRDYLFAAAGIERDLFRA